MRANGAEVTARGNALGIVPLIVRLKGRRILRPFSAPLDGSNQGVARAIHAPSAPELSNIC